MQVLVWGTGSAASEVVEKYIFLKDIIGFIDNDKTRHDFMGKRVMSPEEINGLEYDAILVATTYAEDIYRQCIDLNIDLSRIIFLHGNCVVRDLNGDYCFVEKILGKDLAEKIRKGYCLIRKVEADGYMSLDPNSDLKEKRPFLTDYVRIKSFELAVKEIRKRNVDGNVAEVGVFRGEFAQYLNRAFPDRKLYLFDTFAGFDDTEALRELESGNCTESFIEVYKNTDLGNVIGKMQYREMVVIKKGLFPESLNGLEDKFVFVSIDVDFEESIYNALCYFYPRLNAGGYIFVHDYNSNLRGVEKAVDNYERKNGIKLAKVPLCDSCGSLVITK